MRILLVILGILTTIGLIHSIRDGTHRSCGERSAVDLPCARGPTAKRCIMIIFDSPQFG